MQFFSVHINRAKVGKIEKYLGNKRQKAAIKGKKGHSIQRH